MSDDERRANDAALRAALTTSLGELHALVLAWPIPDGERYAGQPAMVQAAAQMLTALQMDLVDVGHFERAIFRLATPAYKIEWLRSTFNAYAEDLRVNEHPLADDQRAAANRIIDAFEAYEVRHGSYARFVSENGGDYAAKRHAFERGRKRKRPTPITPTERAALVDQLGAHVGHLSAPARAAIERVQAALRGDMAAATAAIMAFAQVARQEQMTAATSECGVLINNSIGAIEAAVEAAEEADDEPPAKVATTA